jgi:hypothetical protein
MVPPEVKAEIERCYEAILHQSLNPSEYLGRAHDIVFEMITFETFIAGTASKILEGLRIDSVERRRVLERPLLLEGRWWQRESGQLFDTEQYPQIREYAIRIERLRSKCNDALTGDKTGS